VFYDDEFVLSLPDDVEKASLIVLDKLLQGQNLLAEKLIHCINCTEDFTTQPKLKGY
jgi:hypothetical protein